MSKTLENRSRSLGYTRANAHGTLKGARNEGKMNIEFDEKAYYMSRGFGTGCLSIRVTPEPNDEHFYTDKNSWYTWPVRAFADAFANAIDFEALDEWDDNEGNTWTFGETNCYGNAYATMMFAYEDNGDIVQIELTPEYTDKIRNGKPFVITGSISI